MRGMTRKLRADPADEPERARFKAALGRRIRDARKRVGLTQGELADAAGVSKTYVFELETRGANPSLDALWTIARALGTGARDLVPETDRDAAASPAAMEELAREAVQLAADLGAHLRLHESIANRSRRLQALLDGMDAVRRGLAGS